jgi:3-phosphoshikimate 1-carboxyvinyltransferase
VTASGAGPAGTAAIPETLSIAGKAALRGVLAMPGDKSISHRCVLLAAMADGTSTIRGLSDGSDVAHTLAAVKALGAEVSCGPGDEIRITGGALHESSHVIDAGNSGTCIRLLAGLAAGLPFLTVLQGDASVATRPMDRIAAPLRLMGAHVDGRSSGRYPPLAVRGGQLRGIDYTTPVASAQVKSAILLAGLTADGPTTVREPASSRRHTEEMLAARGVPVSVDGTTVQIRPSRLSSLDESVPADPSQAAFWLAAAAALPDSDFTIPRLYLGPARNGFISALRRMGADLDIETQPDASHTVRVRSSELVGTDIGPAEIPGLIDEIPALAVAAALAEGVTRIRGAEELRFKESDRIAVLADMLAGFGVPVEQQPDGMVICGGAKLGPSRVRTSGDHRIAMAAAMMALAVEGTSVIEGFGAVSTSYPQFLEHVRQCCPDAISVR